MPGIKSHNPLPEECGKFLAPYNKDIYNKQWPEACETNNMHYQCGINFFWQNCVANPLPGVPMCKQRIKNNLPPKSCQAC